MRLFSDCDSVPLPLIDKKYNKTEEVCPRCVCNYESRNTNIIKVRQYMYIFSMTILLFKLLKHDAFHFKFLDRGRDCNMDNFSFGNLYVFLAVSGSFA